MPRLCPDGAARDGMCLYADRKFSGKHVCVDSDVPVRRRFQLNDKVSSVKLIGDMRVRFYKHRQYRGRGVLIEGGVERPGRNTERQIFVVACFAARAPGATWAGHNPRFVDENAAGTKFEPRPNQAYRGPARVCSYDHWDYQGEGWCFSGDHCDFSVLGIDNRV
ncbi:MAG: peptidase inhibitor family I36 protein [Gammaproteobacteria bacterium]|nr:peptidase inhibitor family I36 protein [Gammaproteobacteria bacterium]